MRTTYRVGFFDLEHQLRRVVEVEASSPEQAASAALQALLAQDKLVSDFGPQVTVEEVTRRQLRIPLATVAGGDKLPDVHAVKAA